MSVPFSSIANDNDGMVRDDDDDGRRASIGGSLKKNDATYEFETRPLFALLFADPFFFWTATVLRVDESHLRTTQSTASTCKEANSIRSKCKHVGSVQQNGQTCSSHR
jgi:hypothetical protein